MAARKSWAGGIIVYPGAPEIPVEATRTTKSTRESTGIKKLCACHQQPIDKTEKCRVDKAAPAGTVSGVERPDGSFAVVDDGQLDAIKAEIESTAFEPLAYEDLDACPLEIATATYNLRTPKKTPGFKSWLRALYDLLEADQKALVGQIVISGRQRVVAVYAHAGVVRMAALAYASEAYAPDQFADITNEAEAAPELLEMLHALAEKNPDSYDLATAEDRSAALTQELVERILGGAPAPAQAAPATAQAAEPDLKAQLERAMGGKKPARTAKAAPTGGKVKA